MVFNGTCNTDFFNHWVEHFLITFHKSEKTQKLIESVDCKVIFLTPYSPDLNPSEKFWAYMKRWIKQHIERCNGLSQAINEFFN
jgi:transposase